jgi:hypothetical protein
LDFPEEEACDLVPFIAILLCSSSNELTLLWHQLRIGWGAYGSFVAGDFGSSKWLADVKSPISLAIYTSYVSLITGGQQNQDR